MTLQHAAHFVQFFDADDRLVSAVSGFVREGIESGATCVVLATAGHRDRIVAQLQAMNLDPAALVAAYRYIAIDARVTLDGFMGEDGPDQQRFHRNMGLLLRQAASRGQPVRVFGELVAVLAEQGQISSAIRMEELWNELSRYHTFTLFCGYPSTALAHDPRSRALVCAIHSHVVQGEA